MDRIFLSNLVYDPLVFSANRKSTDGICLSRALGILHKQAHTSIHILAHAGTLIHLHMHTYMSHTLS